jgi:hypothetical protein
MKHSSAQVVPITSASKNQEGPYGRLFPKLPGWKPDANTFPEIAEKIKELSLTMRESDVNTNDESTDTHIRKSLQTRFDSKLPVGYIYLAQFMVHDISFNPVTLQMRYQNSGSLTNNFRTPRLDLDSLYDRGPQASPYFYDRKHYGKFLISTIETDDYSIPDLPRTTPADQGLAIIADPRNDDNAITSQLHLAFLLAHNHLLEKAKSLSQPFESAKQTLVWLYQYIIWNDLLKRITTPAVRERALKRTQSLGSTKWEAGFETIYNWKTQPFIPLEFSMAAFRMGHSMVKPSYQTNKFHGANNFIPLFSSDAQEKSDLRGKKPISLNNSIQWNWFLEMGKKDKGFPQRARKIDTTLAASMFELPDTISGHKNQSNLAFINLMKGVEMQLPSGSAVAQQLGVKPIPIEDRQDALWYYILKEAGTKGKGQPAGEHLGEVGSTIVCATIAGLLLGDPNSYLRQVPDWTPDQDPLLKADGDDSYADPDGRWTLASIIRLSGLDPDGVGFK